MKLMIDGRIVELNRLPYTGGSYILQIFIHGNLTLTLHRILVKVLTQQHPNGGVMDVEEFKPEEERPDQSGIRVLEGLELEVIDIARCNGYGVMQIE